MQEGVQRVLQRFGDSAGERVQLPLRFGGERDALAVQLLSRLQEIDGVVGDALEVADDMQQLCGSGMSS